MHIDRPVSKVLIYDILIFKIYKIYINYINQHRYSILCQPKEDLIKMLHECRSVLDMAESLLYALRFLIRSDNEQLTVDPEGENNAPERNASTCDSAEITKRCGSMIFPERHHVDEFSCARHGPRAASLTIGYSG